MTTATASVATGPEENATATAGGTRPRLPALATSIGALVVAIVRFWVARGAETIQIIADEPGYLATARLLGAGGPAWNLADAASYSSGYSVILAPWFALSDDPATLYGSAIATNVVLGVAGMVVLVAVARRATRLGPVATVVVATAVSIAPTTATHTQWVLAENLAPLVVGGVLIAAWRLAERPGGARVAAAVAVAVGATLVHSRFLALAVVIAGLLVVLAVRHRPSRNAATLGVLALVAGVVGVRVVERLIAQRLHDVAATSQITERLGDLTQVGGLAVEVVGQSWAQVVGTAGLVGLGAISLVRAAPLGSNGGGSPARDAVVTLDRTGVAVLGAVVAASAAVSMGFLADAYRADHLVYGRYLDPVAAPLVIVGLAALMTGRRRRLVIDGAITLGALAASAAVLWTVRADELTRWAVSPPAIPGLVAIATVGDGIDVVRITMIAGVTLVGLLGVTVAVRALDRTRTGRLASVVLLCLVVVLAGTALTRADPRVDRARLEERFIDDLASAAALVPDGVPVRYQTSPGPTSPYFIASGFAFSDHRLIREAPDATRAAADSPWMIAPAAEPRLAGRGARLVFVNPNTANGLWVEPSPTQDRLGEADALLPEDFPAPLDPVNRVAELAVTEPLRLTPDRRLTGSVEVSRPEHGAIWPTTGGGDPVEGTVRVGVLVRGRDCGCVVADRRARLPGVVAPGESVTTGLDVSLGDLAAGIYDIEVQLVQEGQTRFGPTLRTTARVPSTS